MTQKKQIDGGENSPTLFLVSGPKFSGAYNFDPL